MINSPYKAMHAANGFYISGPNMPPTPSMIYLSEEDAMRAATIANTGYCTGYAHAQEDIRRAIGAQARKPGAK